MSKRLLISFFAFTLLLEISCHKEPLTTESQGKELITEESRDDSSVFLIDTSTKMLEINTKSLNKDFLFRTSLISGGASPMFKGMKTRVVHFERKQNQLYMFEDSSDYLNYEEFKSPQIITSFPIEGLNNNFIKFDFSKGSNELFDATDWYAQDSQGTSNRHMDRSFASNFLRRAYVDSVSFPSADSESLLIDISAQERVESINKTLQMKILLEPFTKNEKFKPFKSHPFEKDLGFFEVEPVLDSKKESVVYASKFDVNQKQIIYAISDNTPKEYREAIKEGILYWNKAFGREVIKVIFAPKGVKAPSYLYNMVQWVDWVGAGFAYADAQMNPKTGEILNAQIYMSSVFAVSSLKQAKRLIDNQVSIFNEKDLHVHDLKKINGKEKFLDILSHNILEENSKRHKSHFGCHHPMASGFMSQISALAARNASSQEYLVLSQHYVRDVVAHEVGHTLGLRHNFAGSLHTRLSEEEKIKNFNALLKDGAPLYKEPVTSSVMDYLVFEDSVVSGYQVKELPKAFDYDYKAIQVLYGDDLNDDNDAPLYFEKEPLFCTDSQVGKYVDCKRFFRSKIPFTHTKLSMESNFSSLPRILASSFYEKASKASRPDLIWDKVFTDSYLFNIAFYLLSPVFNTLNATQEFTSSLQSKGSNFEERKFFSQAERRRQHLSWTLDSLDKSGGFSTVLSFESLFDKEKIFQDFKKALKESIRVDNSPRGSFFLSHFDQIEEILKSSLGNLNEYLEMIKVYQIYYLKNISDLSLFSHVSPLSKKFSHYVANFSEEYLLKEEKKLHMVAAYDFEIKIPLKIKRKIEDKLNDVSLSLSRGDFPKGTWVSYEKAKTKALEKAKNQIQDLLGVGECPEDFSDIKAVDKLRYSTGPKMIVETFVDLLLPDFSYSDDNRVIAASLLSPNRNKSNTFGLWEKSVQFRLFTTMLEDSLDGLPLDKIVLSNQSSELIKWISVNKKIKGKLSSKAFPSFF